jgi:hypothetical protein
MTQAAFWIPAALGVFYGVLGVTFIRRNSKPNCRTCMHWQQCLARDLGISGPRQARCVSAGTRS